MKILKYIITVLLITCSTVANAQIPPLNVPQGGTGKSAFTEGQILFGDTTLRLNSDPAFTFDKLTNTVFINSDAEASGTTYGLRMTGGMTDGITLEGVITTMPVFNAVGINNTTWYKPTELDTSYWNNISPVLISGSADIAQYLGYSSEGYTRTSQPYTGTIDDFAHFNVNMWLQEGTFNNYALFRGREIATGATVGNMWGLYLNDIDLGTGKNHAIETGAGDLVFGTSTRAAKMTLWSPGTTGTALSIANNASTSLMVVRENGNVGIGSTTPGTLFSIGNTTGVNFSNASTTFNTTGGINLKGGGCFAINDNCYGSSVHQYPSFNISTTTAWTGTTTVALGPAYNAETWLGIKCFTNAGTLNVSVYDGTNRMNMASVSTTVGAGTTLSTNNTFTAGEKRYVDVGTPASSPTEVSCTVDKTLSIN